MVSVLDQHGGLFFHRGHLPDFFLPALQYSGHSNRNRLLKGPKYVDRPSGASEGIVSQFVFDQLGVTGHRDSERSQFYLSDLILG